METFTKPKILVENLHYLDQRKKSLARLDGQIIDEPIIELINGFNKLPYCFTLQCCFGHFVYSGQNDPQNLVPLPLADTISRVKYRIAYIAFCIENSTFGRVFFEDLKRVTDIDPNNIQFCSAKWFWERQVNSYVLQVEPDRFKSEDKALLNYNESLKIEKIRNEFFVRLKELLQDQHDCLRLD